MSLADYLLTLLGQGDPLTRAADRGKYSQRQSTNVARQYGSNVGSMDWTQMMKQSPGYEERPPGVIGDDDLPDVREWPGPPPVIHDDFAKTRTYYRGKYPYMVADVLREYLKTK